MKTLQITKENTSKAELLAAFSELKQALPKAKNHHEFSEIEKQKTEIQLALIELYEHDITSMGLN